MKPASLVVGVEDPAVEAEILDFLTRLPGLRVLATSAEPTTLVRKIRDTKPDSVVISPEVLRGSKDLDGARILVVAARETAEALRLALHSGAKGFFLWPNDREELARASQKTSRNGLGGEGISGRAIALVGARGGVGVTFLATSLAAAWQQANNDTVIADLDPFHDDVGAALGVPTSPHWGDLLPVMDELGTEHLDRVLYQHPRGFRVLLSPRESTTPPLEPHHVLNLIRGLRGRFEVVLLHLPRSLDAATCRAIQAAEDLLLVVTLDVLAFREARRLLELFDSFGARSRCELVLNRVSKGEIVPRDAEHVFGMKPIAVIGADRAVPRAQNRGELPAARSAVARRVADLARRITDRWSTDDADTSA